MNAKAIIRIKVRNRKTKHLIHKQNKSQKGKRDTARRELTKTSTDFGDSTSTVCGLSRHQETR